MEICNEQEIQSGVGETRLWTAVILQAIEDWQFGPWKTSQEAATFLFREPDDFNLVCLAAGMNPSNLREKLSRLPQRESIRPIGVERLAS